MGLTDFLKKIGLLRTYGGKGTYKNAKEMPDAFVNPEANKDTDFAQGSSDSSDTRTDD